MAKTQFLQIRITPQQKAALKRLARDSGQGISTYVLERVLPSRRLRFLEILRDLASRTESDARFTLAELNDLLTNSGRAELVGIVDGADVTMLSPLIGNYVAAMVEQACNRAGIPAPAWTLGVPPLDMPYFATALRSLRPHLLRASPVPFKKRNLFVDSALSDRV